MADELEKLLSELESHAFAARANIGSSLSTVRRIILSDELVQAIRKACSESDRAVAALVKNVKELASRAIDPRYESPWDIALAAHLVILQAIDLDAAKWAAVIAQRAPQTWWTPRQALDILNAAKSQPRTENMPTVRAFISNAALADYSRSVTAVLTVDHASESIALSDISAQYHEWPIVRRRKLQIAGKAEKQSETTPEAISEIAIYFHGKQEAFVRYTDNAHSTTDAPACAIREIQ